MVEKKTPLEFQAGRPQGKEARRLIDEIWLTRELKESKSYQEAVKIEEKEQCLSAMQ